MNGQAGDGVAAQLQKTRMHLVHKGLFAGGIGNAVAYANVDKKRSPF